VSALAETRPPSFNVFLAQLLALAHAPEKAAALARDYLAAQAGHFPIIEGTTAHFLYREQPGLIAGVGGEWNGFDARRAIMEPIGGGLLHYAHTFEPEARLDYLIYEVDAVWRDRLSDPALPAELIPHTLRDPLNPRIGPSGLGARSELAMPAYRRPAITQAQPELRGGTVQEGAIRSRALGGSRRAYSVYLPAGYDAAHGPYACAFFHDGGDYLAYGEARAILDNLIAAGAIPPLVAVFVPPQERDVEYNCDDRQVRFLADELLPRLTGYYALSPDRMRRAVIGPSLGGLISLYTGSRRPEAFGLIAAQSSAVTGGTGPDGYDARQAYAAPGPLPFRVHLVIGTYETCFATDAQGRCRDLYSPVRDLDGVLTRAGVPHRYAEHAQGHSWGLWRDTLAEALIYLFGADA
jgi:enterochelin esterase family protein